MNNNHLYNTDLSGNEFRLLCVLADKADDKGVVTMTNKVLGALIGVGERQIANLKKSLKNKGIILCYGSEVLIHG